MAQVEGPGAEQVMRSVGFGFSVFTVVMPGTGNSIPGGVGRAGCHIGFKHTFDCVSCSFPELENGVIITH